MWRVIVILWLLTASMFLRISFAGAADDGRYAQRDPAIHAWFDKLASGKGLCCSFADGRTVDDPDVDSDGNHYRVRVDGVWYDVPPNALVTEPNKFGQAVVWPYKDAEGNTQIRCFLPGAGA
jgi:hypothetical protein